MAPFTQGFPFVKGLCFCQALAFVKPCCLFVKGWSLLSRVVLKNTISSEKTLGLSSQRLRRSKTVSSCRTTPCWLCKQARNNISISLIPLNVKKVWVQTLWGLLRYMIIYIILFLALGFSSFSSKLHKPFSSIFSLLCCHASCLSSSLDNHLKTSAAS